MPKIRCTNPNHADATPSMELYDDGSAHCFSCGFHTRIMDALNTQPVKPKVVEDVEASLREIKQLPMKQIRGLWLHYATNGYYIVWPTNDYYKLRLTSGYTRYIGPSGHTPPLFWAAQLGSRTLVIVEGELNALSVAESSREWDIVSPGSATNFGSKEAELLQLAGEYDRVIIWTDHDSAGITAIWKLLPVLINRGISCAQITQEMDANDVLTTAGYQAVGAAVRRAIKGAQ